MGFKAGRTAASHGRREILDLGTDSALVLTQGHTNTTILCGGATCAVTLPNANTLSVGWNVKFVVDDETAVTTITGVAEQCLGKVITGGDNAKRQLNPPTAILFDVITLAGGALVGDWCEITCITSGFFFVRGDSRVANAITCTT